VELTKRAVDALTYQGENGAACYLWGDDPTGFGCRVYPSGKKSFTVSYYVAGRRRFLILGRYGALTVEQARVKALVAIGKALEGIDPAAKREDARSGATVGELCDTYMERHAKLKKRSWKADHRNLELHILPAWGKRKARSITRGDVAALHSSLGKTYPSLANRVAALVRTLFNLAERWGLVPEGFPNPATHLELFRETKRERWVTPDELPRLAAAIDQESNQSARYALWLYLLTGCRRNELLATRWEDVDWTRSELRLTDPKATGTAKQPRYVPLSAPALALLRQIPRVEGNPYVLPGARRGGHLVNIERPWQRVRAVAGVEDVRLHDLRRTVGSWLAQAGNSLHLIGRVLGHTNASTTAIYARFAQDHVREALEQHGARIMGVAGITPSAEVVEITQGKKDTA
jgi:integrase